MSLSRAVSCRVSCPIRRCVSCVPVCHSAHCAVSAGLSLISSYWPPARVFFLDQDRPPEAAAAVSGGESTDRFPFNPPHTYTQFIHIDVHRARRFHVSSAATCATRALRAGSDRIASISLPIGGPATAGIDNLLEDAKKARLLNRHRPGALHTQTATTATPPSTHNAPRLRDSSVPWAPRLALFHLEWTKTFENY